MTQNIISQATEPADEELFAVTPENCGEMPLDECEVAMTKAEKWYKEIQAETEVIQEEINQMHQEAIQILSERIKSPDTE